MPGGLGFIWSGKPASLMLDEAPTGEQCSDSAFMYSVLLTLGERHNDLLEGKPIRCLL
jgi:hypothetical protein